MTSAFPRRSFCEENENLFYNIIRQHGKEDDVQNFMFYSPTKIIFGRDTERNVGQEILRAGGHRVLLHYGSQSAKRSGLLDRVTTSLQQAGLAYFALGGVEPNPKLSLVRKGIALCLENQIDFVLAVGGGSVIDSAKAISVGAGDSRLDLWEDVFLKKQLPNTKLPVACILTLAASGSEMSASMVITNEDGLIKRGYSNDLFRPLFSIMNPELTYTMPAYQTACGCADVMMHTLDRFFTPTRGNGLTDMLAYSVLKTVVKHAPTLLKEPDSYEARSEIMWAGSLSHNTLTGLGAEEDFAPHQLGHELSGKYDATHGATLTAIWSSWARFVCQNRPERFAEFGAEVFGLTPGNDSKQNALNAIAAAERFFRSLGTPISIGELLGRTISDEEIDELSRKCTFDLTRTIGSFMKLGYDEIRTIYSTSNVF
jgi:alcohol dehydrogenase YqhD (iron-dependent ADH family)